MDSGDSPRRIHWKATARHQELLSRVYEPSKEQQILLFLNVATLERHWFGTIPELQERTISVAASLASMVAEQRLPVGLIANGTLPGSDQPLRLLPGRNPEQLTSHSGIAGRGLILCLHAIEEVAAEGSAPSGLGRDHGRRHRHRPRSPAGLAAGPGRSRLAGVVLVTLAKVIHIPHLVRDIIAPLEVQP